jgi:hypothetical protein
MLKKDSASSVVHSVILGILGRAEVSAVTPSPPSSSKTSNKGAEEPTPVPPQPPKNVAKQSSKSAEEVPNNDKRPIAGFSYNHRGATDSNPNATNVWRKGDDGRFRVRIGPNYKKNGKKAPSSQSLYELIAVDLIQSDKRMTDFSQYLRYPSLDLDTHHEGVPQLFIVNGSLPMETPSMMSPASDGKTLNVLFYFAIRPSTCEALANLATAPPAVKLLKEFCTKAPNTPNMFGRFKCIGMARNYDEAGMPSMFKSFNGKPVLVRNCKATKGGSGSLYRGSNFLEMNVNIRMWPYLAKQGLGFLFATSHKVDLDVAFVIEGKDDSELPEVLLGAAQLTKVKLDAAHVWK